MASTTGGTKPNSSRTKRGGVRLVMNPMTMFDTFERNGIIIKRGAAPVRVSETQAMVWCELRDSDGHVYVVQTGIPCEE